jgi:NADPH2:quinone reductase
MPAHAAQLHRHARRLRASAETFAAAVRRGDVRAEVDRRYALREVQRAHTELESRATTGAAILVP